MPTLDHIQGNTIRHSVLYLPLAYIIPGARPPHLALAYFCVFGTLTPTCLRYLLYKGAPEEPKQNSEFFPLCY